MNNDVIEQDKDIQGAVVNDEDSETLKPIPDFIKYGAMALGGLILIIILWFIFSSSDKSETNNAQSLVDIENIESAEPADDLEMYANTVDFQDSHPVDFVSSLDKIASISKSGAVNEAKEVNETALSPSEENSEIELKLTKLDEQFNQLMTENNQRQQSQDLLINDLQTQILSQTVQIEQLQKNLKSRRQSFVKAKKRRAKPYKKQALPFTLVSVDQWGDDTYAVVRLYGRLYEVTAGQSVDNDNWSVKSIDWFGQMAVFTNKRGVIRELFVKS